MGVLYLVRHGQASFLSDDYDRLSPRGEEQARRLGEHWASIGLRVDAVFAGPRRRQWHTGDVVGDSMKRAGLGWPERRELQTLDEHHGGELLDRHLPELVAASPRAAEIVQAFHGAEDREARVKAADRLLRHALERWMRGETGDVIESFSAFRARADEAVTTLRKAGRTVVAFTSGGTIGAATAGVLRTDDEAALELGLVVHNASVTSFLFRDDRISLSELNGKPHLPSDLHTYR